MKTMKLLPLLVLLLLALPGAVQAQFTYTTNNGTITITGYIGSGGSVIIPSTINGLPVTAIRDNAFNGINSLTSVTIPDSVTSIGTSFNYCTSLTNVTIGNSVTSIGSDAFYFCTRLSAITVDTNNPAYSSVDEVLFDKSQTTLIQYPAAHAGTSYTIPNSVTSIGDWAFGYCTSLTNVTIPNSVISIGSSAFYQCGLTNVTIGSNVTSIGGYAFYYCTSLTAITVDTNNPAYSSVDGVFFNKSQTTLIQWPGGKAGSITIPNSVTRIETYAFSQCYRLTSVTIGTNITSIGDEAFEYCFSLTNVTIPNSVTSIGESSFGGCGLTSITIPNSVTKIGQWAFSSCTSLTNVTIGNSVISIGYGAFYYCTSLTAITVDTNNLAYSSVDGVLFSKSQRTLIQWPWGKAGSYTVPNSVKSIGGSAFEYCTSLTNVTIGTNVTSIGSSAFAECTSLTGVYFKGNAPNLGDSSVFYDDNKTTVYYLPGTMGWSTTFGGRPTKLWNPQVQTSGASFGVRTNQFGFNITGTSGLVIVVEACTNFANSVWIPVATKTLTSGSVYFCDPQWTNYPGRFYRLRSP